MDNKSEPTVASQEITLDNPELLSLREHKSEAYNWQKRRHLDWTENYTLYRDKVIVNRFIQRQSVNIPLMKTVIKTSLKETDDPPLLTFDELDNDKQKEILFNEYWSLFAKDQKLVIKDLMDKKQEMLYGRTFKKINVENGKMVVDIVDPQDVLVTRYCDPSMIHTARYLVHQHIFVPLATLEHNPNYDQKAVERLKVFYATQRGLIKAEENAKSLEEKNRRMELMGATDVNTPVIGETYVELNEHYLLQWDEEHKQEEYYLITTCDDMETLSKKRLEEVIDPKNKCVDHYWRTHNLFNSWADDVELSDIWSDGVADIIRTPNKIANMMISQIVENRTLRNYSMYFYDSTVEGFKPQTYEPAPFGWYPAPGDPNQTMKQVTIPDLGESIPEMEFVMNMANQAAATPDPMQGVINKKTMTKAEYIAALQEAQDRVRSMSKYYNDAWEEFGTMFVKLVEAQADNLVPVKIFKKGYKGTIFSTTISPSDWRSKAGYQVRVIKKDEKDKQEQQAIQKLNAISPDFQTNKAFQDIRKKKELAFAGLNPDEVKEVMDFEKEAAMKALTQPQQPQQGQLPAGAAPQTA